ncbi:MAG: dehydrogenase [Candidatus Scalindua sp. AMX11]|nr:MAG: dehydrogenase [Candidatus Scalindua sp.]NOG82959.1 zinc-binding dehydrogenase [Planctomycetota bacterium]RZV68741.1 MAG: dehydrogenase [Candidatus Scalindua sp. SCAELEC01]TDE63843.1 MAG: dehydrogenase [Candidatus Scalindua sp. AMX11]
MKQILQNLKTGKTELVNIPSPRKKYGHYLIRSSTSLISAGTERMLVDFGKAGIISKARQQPDKVRMVYDKIKTDGLLTTIDAVQAKLDQPLPMGYCNVGRVLEAGEGSGLQPGDRVASNGNHAEIVCVPYNLCARIPDNVSDETASFTVIGAIGLQGIRLAKPTLGESFVVTGLGLVGLVTVQLLLAHGCRVLGIDFDSRKCELARSFGASVADLSNGTDPVAMAMEFSRGRGVDGVLVCASSKSNDIMHQAANMCRKRGRIVLIGVVGLELSRADFFKSEVSFQVSCSYGPGRYDPLYEEKGQDYPVGYVRWTEQRNFEAVLDMMASGKLDMMPLISHRFPLDKAVDAYKVLAEDRAALGILLQYPSPEDKQNISLKDERTIQLNAIKTQHSSTDEVVIGFIGAGNYATRTLIPAFKQTGAVLKSVASSGGVSGVHAGRKYGIQEATTDTSALIANKEINTVVIATWHNSHASLTCEALEAGKNVFVEKPLCMTLNELEQIESFYSTYPTPHDSVPILMVGFNRRFAPQIQKMKSLLESVQGPKSFIMTVNAGAIPEDHWTQDPSTGGGRIIGEACHFIDLLRFLAGDRITSSSAVKMKKGVGDTLTIQLSFADGSLGTVHYFANGSKKFPKERLEVFASGRILQLDNFRTMKGLDWPGFKKMNLLRQDKGQKNCTADFVKAIKEGTSSPIPLEELFEVSRVIIALAHG